MIIQQTELKAFKPEFEFYCFTNCYHQWLHLHSIENAFYYLDCTLNWKLEESEDDLFGYTFSSSEIFTSVLPSHRNKVQLFDQTNFSSDEIWERNINLLKEGRPFISAVDVYYLPYTPYYEKKHSYHALLVNKVDKNNNLSLIDWYPPWYYVGELNFSQLDQARRSENPNDGLLSGNPIRYLWSELEADGWSESSENLIIQTIESTINRFYETYNKLSESSENTGCYSGVWALNALLDKICQYASAEANIQSRFLGDLHGKLYFVPTRKSLFKGYIEQAYHDFGFIKFKKIINMMNESISEWKKFLLMIVKTSMETKDENYSLIVQTMNDLIFKEKDINYLLYDAIETIK